MVSRSTVKAQPHCHPTSTFLTRETVVSTCMGLVLGNRGRVKQAGRQVSVGMASDKHWAIPVGFCMKLFQSNGVGQISPSGCGYWCPALADTADESRFVPTHKWPPASGNCSVYS